MGSPTCRKIGSTSVAHWDYRCIALRQEELSEFIRATKGTKYNGILPLLGLSCLELAAGNVHKLVQSIERQCNINELKSKVSLSLNRCNDLIGNKTRDRIFSRLDELRIIHDSENPVESQIATAKNILHSINTKILSLDDDQRCAAAIGEIGNSDLQIRLNRVFVAAEKIAEIAEPLIKERLEVLVAAEGFSAVTGLDSGKVLCPACGQEVEAKSLLDHVNRERDRLSGVQKFYDLHTVSVNEVCDEIARIRTVAVKADLIKWHDSLPVDLMEGVKHLQSITIADLRKSCSSDDISELQLKVCPLIARAAIDAKKRSPQVQMLVIHQNEVQAIANYLRGIALQIPIIRAEALIKLTKQLEIELREEIANRAREVFESISKDIYRYWKVLQPNDRITGVCLIIPTENDKAVEVALQFHGKKQNSPRLTLSEGQRNALGLCIFLAMANKSSELDRPIVLDDVVISFDRDHRSRVGVLLRQEFAMRQVLLLTHDREWYLELQRTLPPKHWGFRRINPYMSPVSGITFYDHGLDIASAKAKARTAPEEALSSIRRIMDVALSEISERIRLPLPHLRGDDNDHRTAGQFLIALERNATKSFRIKVENAYVPYTDAITAIKKAKPELAIWGNRGTQTFSSSPTEAEDLIDHCEEVLKYFICVSCDTPVGDHENGSNKIECRCGNIQWRSQ
jgi:hypothetical protein